MKTSFKFLMALPIAVSLLACNKENPSGSDTPQPEPPQPKEYNRQTDSLALVAIYNASNGANWTKNKWNLAKPMDDSEEKWTGVTVDENTGRVTKLKITAASTIPSEWELPSEIGDLTELTDLWFNGQKVKGALPDAICNLTKLKNLYFQNDNLSGSLPANLGNLVNLEAMYLNNNANLEGTIPTSIGSLTKLQKFNISNTKVGGALPAAMEKCSALSDFYISGTKVTSIAIDWSKFTAMKAIDVSATATLEEPLPVSLGRMETTATTLSISMQNCNFTGNVPESWGNLPTVTGTLKIFGNKLEGVLPNAFTAHPKYAASTLWKASTNILPQQDGYGLTEPEANGGSLE